MVMRFDDKYKDLICEDVEKRQLKCFDDRNPEDSPRDPWIDSRPPVPGGFIEKYMLRHSE